MRIFAKGPANYCASTVIRVYELLTKGLEVAESRKGWKNSATCEKARVSRRMVLFRHKAISVSLC